MKFPANMNSISKKIICEMGPGLVFIVLVTYTFVTYHYVFYIFKV